MVNIKKFYLLVVFLLFGLNLFAQQTIHQDKTVQKNTGFIENKGQIHDQNYEPNPTVKYLLNLNNGLNVQLKTNSFSYDTYIIERTKKEKKNDETEMLQHPFDSMDDYDITYHFHRVDIELVGANPNPEIIAEYPSEEYLNYYNGVTPEKGATYVRYYQKVTYKNIYPDIDLEFEARTGTDKPVEYNFIIHPGADASRIRLKYHGANETILAEDKINIKVAHGNFYESIPASYLEENSETINIRYRTLGKDEYGFHIPGYNRERTLIIDPLPSLSWATYYGGSELDEGNGIITDYREHVAITGTTRSTTAIATSGAHQTLFEGNQDIFVVKFDSSGNRFWGTYYGGNNVEVGKAITVASDGNIYITGIVPFSISLGFTTLGAHQSTHGGSDDAFIISFDSSGKRNWATYYGGNGAESGDAIKTDQQGNIYLFGATGSISNIASPGAHQTTYGGGGYDVFIAKFKSTGQRIWGTYYGGNGEENYRAYQCLFSGIITDEFGNVYLSGRTNSLSSIATPGAYQEYLSGDYDVFIVKFDSSGKRIWGTYYGGTDDEEYISIAVGESGNIYITGTTKSLTSIASSSAHQPFYGGGTSDAFLAKFDSSGKRIWGTYFGGINPDYSYAIAANKNGHVFIAGLSNSPGLITPGSSYRYRYNTGTFIAKFDSSGKRLWCAALESEINDICVDPYKPNIYFTGRSVGVGSNLMITKDAHQTVHGGVYDAFIAKLHDYCGPSSDTSNVIACDSFNYHGKTLYSNGEYIDTFTSCIGCDSVGVLFLILFSTPDAYFTVNDSVQYLGGNYFHFKDSSTFKDTATLFAYLWDFGDGDTNTLKNPVHSYDSSGVYEVKLKVFSAICMDSFSYTVRVFPAITADFQSGNLCSGDSAIFLNTTISKDSIISVYWDMNNDGDFSDASGSPAKYRFPASGTYSVGMKVFTADTFAIIYKKIDIIKSGQADFSADSNICQGDSVSLMGWSVSTSDSIVSYLWDFDNNGITDDSSGASTSFICSAGGTIYSRLTIVTDKGCSSSVVKAVKIYYLPVPDFSVSNVCEKDTAWFTNLSTITSDSIINFLWDYGDGNDAIIRENHGHYYVNAGLYTVRLVALSDKGCKDTLYKNIEIFPKPMVNLSFSGPSRIYENQNVTITANGTFVSALWTTGSSNISITVNKEGSYGVEVSDINGCQDTASAWITVIKVVALIITDVITPNGDNINDYLLIYDLPYFAPVSISIFNRWGDVFYSSNNYQNDWDATYKGEKLPEDAYYYILRTRQGVVYKGTVSVFR